MMEVTPHLKCVLKNYQHSATKSLQGPGLSLAAPKHEIPSPELSKEEEFVPAPFPVQQVPILTIPDKSCSERSETILEGETISCFVVGGEKRLCLPQVLNSVLRDFTLMQINQECDHLQIYCSRCTPEQLNVLKDHGILPSSAPSCGLITKTDAERLCSALLHGQNITPLRPRKTAFSFGVYHECFGKCKGVCYPELFTSKNAKCIECKECQGGFSPQQFVCHVHRYLENRTVHWGFDSCNWRCYLYVCKDQVDEEQCVKYLDDMQQQYEGKMPFPQPQIDVGMKRKQVLANLSEDFLKTESLKKQKLAEYMPLNYNSLPNGLPLQQIYASIEPVVYNQYFQDFGNVSINRHISAFKPVPQIIKESKIRHALSINRYSDPPILQNPERVILMSDSERFERSFQPNVALAPPTPKKHRYGKVNETLPIKDIISPVIKTEHIKTENDVSSNHLNGPTTVIKQEEVIRKTPEATKVVEAAVSVVQRTNSPRYNPEIELSTDTEDSASETSEKLTDVAKLEEVLKPLDAILRGRILEFFKTVTREHERLIQENNTKDNKIIELELRNTELMKEIEEVRSTCHKNRNGGSEIVNNHHNNNNDIDNNCESDEISSNNNECNVDNLVTDCSSSDKTNNISSDKNVEENDQQHQYSKQKQQHSVIASLAELEKGPVVKIEPE